MRNARAKCIKYMCKIQAWDTPANYIDLFTVNTKSYFTKLRYIIVHVDNVDIARLEL